MKDQDTKKIVDLAKGLEGLYRHTGVHPAGVIISKTLTTDYVPVMQKGEDAPIIAQWDMDGVEQCGQLKIDFLGLRNLAVIDLCIDMVEERHGVRIDPDLLPLDDELTFKMLCAGHSQGVFQLESPGMREMMLGLQPSCIEDLMALVSLYRPGPLNGGLDKIYIRCKHGRTQVHYDHPLLEPILSETYGILLYQDSILLAARQLAGFNVGEADDLRKAIGKKQMDKIGKFREAFVAGCQKNGVAGVVANKIYSDIEHFGGYGFNASHAASYALIAYWTAYFKAHYPAEYMASLLSSVDDKKSRAVAYFGECRRLGIRVRPPHLELSGLNFRVLSDNEILYGWLSVDGFGHAIADKLMTARDEASSYKSIYDFLRRCPAELLDKGVFERLVSTGALDYLVPVGGQLTRSDKAQLLEVERKYLKAYVTEHPLAASWIFLEPQVTATIEQLDDMVAGQRVTVAGVMSQIQSKRTRRGDLMYHFDLEDLTSRVNVVVFSRDAEKLNPVEGEIVLIDARIAKSGDDDHPTSELLFEGVRRPTLPEDVGGPPIRLKAVTTPGSSTINQLSETIDQHPGDSPVYLEFVEGLHVVVFRFDSSASFEAETVLREVLQ